MNKLFEIQELPILMCCPICVKKVGSKQDNEGDGESGAEGDQVHAEQPLDLERFAHVWR